MWGKGSKRGRERIPSRLNTSAEPDGDDGGGGGGGRVQLALLNQEIMTPAKVGCLTD